MQIVIDIDEKYRELIVNPSRELGFFAIQSIRKSIKNGTPLPKGHGRLIDADAYVRNVAKMPRINTKTIGLALQETPTIIEADKED